MRDLGPLPPTRVAGRGRLLASLRALLARVQRFSQHRAATDHESRWANKLADELQAAYLSALDSPGARLGLASVDARTARTRKTPAADPAPLPPAA